MRDEDVQTFRNFVKIELKIFSCMTHETGAFWINSFKPGGMWDPEKLKPLKLRSTIAEIIDVCSFIKPRVST